MGSQQQQGSNVKREVEGLLARTPSFSALDAGSRRALSDSMVKIAEYLSADPAGSARLATQMAPSDLQRRLSPGGQTTPATPAAPAPATTGSTSTSPSGSTGRVGEVARATLNAIDFPSFVASLIQGTFQAIVDSSIQQMQAYAELLKNVAMTVDQFMNDNVTEGAAKDYLADQHGDFLVRDMSGGSPQLKVASRRGDDSVPSFFKDLGFESPNDIDEQAMNDTVVPAARRQIAEQRQQTLATMVLLGINRVVVDSGEIDAKLMFHIDASDQMQMRFDQNKTTVGTMARSSGTSPFSAQALMVNTASVNAQSAINVRADLTGRVNVKFRSETFPLERFADSAAIQLINSNAKVPAPAPAPAATATPAATTPAAPIASASAPVATPPMPSTSAPKAPASQGLGYDPWAPEVAG
jgi:hypothetical protein